MFDFLLSEENKKLKNEVRLFVKDEISHSLLQKMDKDELRNYYSSQEYLKKYGAK